MKRSWSIVVLAVAVTGCAAPLPPAPTPTAVPSPTSSVATTGTSTPDPATTSTASPDQVLVAPADGGAYVQGVAITIPLDGSGAGAWTLPSNPPLIGNPDGDTGASEPQGFTLLPLDCPAAGGFSIVIQGQPFNPAPWESQLGNGELDLWSMPSTAVSPSCADGIPSTYLDVGYQAFEAGAPLDIQVAMTEVPPGATMPAQLTFVPVYARDSSGTPYRTLTSSVTIDSATGAERALGTTPRQVFETTMGTPAGLPDGSTATHLAIELTGCDTAGAKAKHDLTLTLVVGDAEPVELGWCGASGISVANNDLPSPAPGTRLAVYASGGTTRSAYRLSTFEWREPPVSP